MDHMDFQLRQMGNIIRYMSRLTKVPYICAMRNAILNQANILLISINSTVRRVIFQQYVVIFTRAQTFHFHEIHIL